MCGVVGVINKREAPANASVLRNMMGAIAHRGPDATGTWLRESIGLGHARLSILDLSPNANQPFITDDAAGVLSYNGEVYNFSDLRAELEREGVRFRTTSDSEVVLNALHQWGPEIAVPRFNGMFALAYYDLRIDTMWLARDRMGIKPLYIVETADAIVFASEVKALLRHPSVARRPDLHVLTTKLLCESIEEDWTPYESIRSLRSGHIAKFHKSKRSDTCYYDLLDSVSVDRILSTSLHANESVDQLDELFQASVSLHLASDAPLAAMCSGGVDSSLIAAFARRNRPDLTAYVADVKGPISEGAAARQMGQHLGIPVRQVDVNQETYLRLWPQAVWHNDQPGFFPHDPAFLAVAHACREDGIKVLLTGEGADELFGGYPWQFATWQMYRRRRRLDRWLPQAGMIGQLRQILGKLAASDAELAARMPFHSSNDHSRITGHSTAHQTPSYYFALAAFGNQCTLRHEAIFSKLSSVTPIEDRAFLARSIDDMYGYLRMLLQRNDRMGMAASLESRFPFLENRLIDFALHLPFNCKYQSPHGKWIVKQLAARILPKSTVFGSKIGFSVPVSMWMPCIPLLRDGWLAETLKWDRRSIDPIVNRVSESSRLAFLLLSTEIWGRLFFCDDQPDGLATKLGSFCESQ